MRTTVVFAYGSLMFEPEMPNALLDRHPARLQGHHRWFDKRSRGRGSPSSHAPLRPAVPGFEHDGHRWSLVLGTRDGGHMDGLALVYPADAQEELLQRLQRREGPGYRARRVHVDTRGSSQEAVTWVSNPASELAVDLDLATQADVLLAATPRSDVDGRARGAEYLLGVLNVLDELGVWDPRMEALGELVRRGIAPPEGPGYS